MTALPDGRDSVNAASPARLRLPRAVANFGSSAAAQIERREAWAVAAVLVVCALAQVRAARRDLWYDELFTFYISRLHDLGSLFRALPADGNPPFYYLLARVSLDLFGPTPLAVRLPAILGFLGALVAVYVFVRRREGPVFALFGMLSLAASGMAAYGSQARPYSLLLGFTGLTLVSWQAATEQERLRGMALVGVALGIAGAIGSHHYGAVHVGVPLAFGETVRLVRRRRFDFPLYCAGAAGLAVLAITLPFAAATQAVMLHYVEAGAAFWAKPGLPSLLTYSSMVCWWLPAALVGLLWCMKPVAGSWRGKWGGRTPVDEVAAAVGLALLVPIVVGLTWAATGYYLARYAIGAAMGIAILAGLGTGACFRQGKSYLALCAVPLMAGALIAPSFPDASTIVHRFLESPDAHGGPDWVAGAARGGEPIVVASALTYMPMWFYAPPSLRPRLHYLSDLPFAVRQKDFLPELSLVVNQSVVPSKADTYRTFLAAHHRFYLYCGDFPRLEWVRSRLEGERWNLRLLSRRGHWELYVVEAPAAQNRSR